MADKFCWNEEFESLNHQPEFISMDQIKLINSLLAKKSPPNSSEEILELHQQLTNKLLKSHSKSRLSSGDVQTRLHLARYTTTKVFQYHQTDRLVSLLDPTCGTAIFLLVAIDHVMKHDTIKLSKVVGIERNTDSAALAWFFATMLIDYYDIETTVEIRNVDLIEYTMSSNMDSFDILIGNPPWITWTDLPQQDKLKWKTVEAQDFSFVEAKGMQKALGETNTDISAAFILISLQELATREAVFGFLLKPNIINTSTVRHFRRGIIPHSNGRSLKLMEYIKVRSNGNFHTGDTLYSDLIIGQTDVEKTTTLDTCQVMWTDGKWMEMDKEKLHLVQIPDDIIYKQDKEVLPLDEKESVEIRHGIKHDCSEVFNIDEPVAKQLNWECVYPTVKSRHVQSDGWTGEFDLVLVPATSLQDIPEKEFKQQYPAAYNYLVNNKTRLQQRKSRWLKNREFYSIFGIGDYSFVPFKVAWVRLGWKPVFVLLEPVKIPSGEILPIIPSDHFMFIPVEDKSYGKYLVNLLNTEPYQNALETLSSKTKSSLPKRIVKKLKLPSYDEFQKLFYDEDEIKRLKELKDNDQPKLKDKPLDEFFN